MLGNALFKRALWNHVVRARLVASLTLGTLIPLALVSSALVLLAAATTVINLAA